MPPALLYNKVLTVLKIQDDDKRNSDILFSIEEVLHSIKKEIIIRLTDEVDQFFLFQLKLTEEDFQILKAQQGLLIDFKSFPQKVIELLEECRERNTRESGRFSLIFKMSGCGGFSSMGQLSIMETNEFKHLNHLQLEFHPGTDNDVKNYILEKLKTTKHKLDQMTTAYEKAEYELKLCKESLMTKANESSQVREVSERRIREMESSLERRLADIQIRHKDELNDASEKHTSLVKKLEQKNSELKDRVQSLTDVKKKQDSQIEELKDAFSTLEEEKKCLYSENLKLKRNVALLESDLSGRSTELRDVVTRLSKAESDMISKDEAFRREHEQLQLEREAKIKLQKDLDQTKLRVNKLIDRYKQVVEENKNLKSEKQCLEQKMSHRTNVSIKQEECITQKTSEIESLTKRIRSLEDEFSQKFEQLTRLEVENKSLHVELESCEKKLQDNEHVISWLRKQTQDSYTNTSRDHTLGTTMMPLYTNPILTTSPTLNLRSNINDNNNTKPITCEDFIDQKYLRSSLDEPIMETIQPGRPIPPPAHSSNVRQPPPANGPAASKAPRHPMPYTSTPATRMPTGASAAHQANRRSIPGRTNPTHVTKEVLGGRTTNQMPAYLP